MTPYVYRYQGRDILPLNTVVRRGMRLPPAVNVTSIKYHVPGLGIGGSDVLAKFRNR